MKTAKLVLESGKSNHRNKAVQGRMMAAESRAKRIILHDKISWMFSAVEKLARDVAENIPICVTKPSR